MHYRNIATATGIHFAFDLTQLPAVVEEQLVIAINRNDPNVVLLKAQDPFDNELYRNGG